LTGQKRKVRGLTKGHRKSTAMALEYAAAALPLIRDAQARGCTTYAAIARDLNAQGIPTRQGKTWTRGAVREVLRRLGLLPPSTRKDHIGRR
jgi:Recombinase